MIFRRHTVLCTVERHFSTKVMYIMLTQVLYRCDGIDQRKKSYFGRSLVFRYGFLSLLFLINSTVNLVRLYQEGCSGYHTDCRYQVIEGKQMKHTLQSNSTNISFNRSVVVKNYNSKNAIECKYRIKKNENYYLKKNKYEWNRIYKKKNCYFLLLLH